MHTFGKLDKMTVSESLSFGLSKAKFTYLVTSHQMKCNCSRFPSTEFILLDYSHPVTEYCVFEGNGILNCLSDDTYECNG